MRSMWLIMAWLAAGPLYAEIYRWVDSSGQVHFGERPASDNAQRIDLPGRSAAPGAVVPSEADRRVRQQRMLEAFEYERARKAEQEAEAAQRSNRRSAQCKRLQQNWRRLSHPGPIYESDGQGGRRYLDDAQRAAEKDRLRPVYREICGEPPG